MPRISLPVTGTHIIAEMIVPAADTLVAYDDTRTFVERLIREIGLTQIGSAYHNFDEGGFTCLVGLAESHISIHTWPETNFLTMDVYLCNHTRDNTALTHRIFDAIKNHFQPLTIRSRTIRR